MIMTTLGASSWPQTAEDRVLGRLLALFAFAIFSYITATSASYVVGQDRKADRAPAPAESAAMDELAALRTDVAALRQQIDVLVTQAAASSQPQSDRDDGPPR